MTADGREPVDVFRAACAELEQGAPDVRRLMQLLVNVVSAALDLPYVEPDTEDSHEGPPDLDAASQEVAQHVARLIGARDEYLEIFDPYEEAAQPVTASLTDDISDIYRDLRRGLYDADRGRPNDASFAWRFGFETHWGEHATGAIRALHRLLEEDELEDED